MSSTPSSGSLSFSQLGNTFSDSSNINLGDYYKGGARVPNNSVTTPASGEISLSDLRGIGRYKERADFVTSFSGNYGLNRGGTTATDGTYIAMLVNAGVSGSNRPAIAVFSVATGLLVWAKYFFQPIGTQPLFTTSFALGNSGDLYIHVGEAVYRFNVANGNLVWDNYLQYDGTQEFAGTIRDLSKISMTAYNGELYLMGGISSPTSQIVFIKYNSSGTIQYKKIWESAVGGSFSHLTLTPKNSLEFILTGQLITDGGILGAGFIAEFDPGVGNLSQGRIFGTPSNNNSTFNSCAIASNNSIYTMVIYTPTGAQSTPPNDVKVRLVKFSNTSNIVWARDSGINPNNDSSADVDYVNFNVGKKMKVDSEGNIYISFSFFPAEGREGKKLDPVIVGFGGDEDENVSPVVIQKWDSSGNLLQSREFYRSPADPDYTYYDDFSLLIADDELIFAYETSSYSTSPSVVSGFLYKPLELIHPGQTVTCASGYMKYNDIDLSESSVSMSLSSLSFTDNSTIYRPLILDDTSTTLSTGTASDSQNVLNSVSAY